MATFLRPAKPDTRLTALANERRSVPDIVDSILDQALALSHRPDVFWMQQGIRNDPVAAKAEAAGMKVVMDRCPKIDIPRLGVPRIAAEA